MTVMAVPPVIALALLAVVLGPVLVRVSDGFCLEPPLTARRRSSWLLSGAVLATLVVLAALAAPSPFAFAFVVAGGAVLIVVSLVDIAERRIPDLITYPAAALGLTVSLAVALTSAEPGSARAALVGGVLFALVLLLLHTARPDAMGRGDVKLAFPLGCAVGWATGDPVQVTVAVGWTLAAAALLGLATAALAETNSAESPFRRRAIAFGPALSTASVSTILVALAWS